MILGTVQKHVELASQQSSVKATARFAFSRKGINITTVCLAIAGTMSIAPSAFSHSTERSLAPSTCATDPQGLMCDGDPRELEGAVASQTSQTLPALSDRQMEQLSDLLLGLLYFVMPIGFGLGLFLHDRYQAYRAATLEAQIKLLEKLWEQTPQA